MEFFERIPKEVEIKNTRYKRKLNLLLIILLITTIYAGTKTVELNDRIWLQTECQLEMNDVLFAFSAQEAPENILEYSRSDFPVILSVYQFSYGIKNKSGSLRKQISFETISFSEYKALEKLFLNYYGEAYSLIKNMNQTIWLEEYIFPVGKVESIPQATVFYENSWGYERTFGGKRTHEGCDLMASVNQSGIYPIYSVCDGVVEKIGWLPQGGYRVGIRSDSGIYFYYAHLSDYANIKEHDIIKKGQLLGYMGDTGYSEIPGTTGNFPVHLHFGIYFKTDWDEEYAINSYLLLKVIQQE